MLKLKYYKNFKTIESVWRKLTDCRENYSPYQDTSYVDIFWKHRIPYIILLRITPLFCVFYENNEAVVVIPLFKKWLSKKASLFGLKAGFGYLDIISDCSVDEKKLSECLELLGKDGKIDAIYSKYVREDCLWGRYLLGHGCNYDEVPCVVIELPDRYDEYWDKLSKHVRQNLRTSYNRANKDGIEISFRHCHLKEMSSITHQEIQSLYMDRQVDKYGKTKYLYNFFNHYIDIGTHVEAEYNYIEIFLLYMNGKIAAFFDGIIKDSVIVIPRLAISEEYLRYSPGNMLINEAIKYFLEDTKIRSIDLTHGNERYKLAMGGKENRCVNGLLHFG